MSEFNINSNNRNTHKNQSINSAEMKQKISKLPPNIKRWLSNLADDLAETKSTEKPVDLNNLPDNVKQWVKALAQDLQKIDTQSTKSNKRSRENEEAEPSSKKLKEEPRQVNDNVFFGCEDAGVDSDDESSMDDSESYEFDFDNIDPNNIFDCITKVNSTSKPKSEKFPRLTDLEVESIKQGEKIGQGAFGEVLKIDEETVVKEVSLTGQSKRAVAKIKQEIAMLEQLKNKGVTADIVHVAEDKHVKLETNVFDPSSDENDKTLYIFQKIATGVDMTEMIKDSTIDLDTRLRIAIELIDSLAIIHEEGIMHRDIKPENIKIDVNKEKMTMILDFGISSSKTNLPKTDNAGTIIYRAPFTKTPDLEDKSEVGIQATIDYFNNQDKYAMFQVITALLTATPLDEGPQFKGESILSSVLKSVSLKNDRDLRDLCINDTKELLQNQGFTEEQSQSIMDVYNQFMDEENADLNQLKTLLSSVQDNLSADIEATG